MERQSDLIIDSKLGTKFESAFTIHIYRERSHSSQRRAVQRLEYWSQETRIGGGAFGSVWLQKCVQGQRDVAVRAVKQISQRPLRNGTTIDYSRELEAIAKFSHEKYSHCFVKSFGWYEGGQDLFIAMEYLPHGDLEHYLFISPPLSEETASDITYQILEGLSYMHDNRFAHRDLKPGNILIQSCPPQQWWVKLADFGISKRLEDETAKSTLLKGTIGYIAPELHGFAQIGSPFAADMWSLGEITFQLMTKQPVFQNIAIFATYAINGQNFPASAQLLAFNVSSSGQDFIKSLMVPAPEKRLTAEQAQEHQWMNQYLTIASQPPPTIQALPTSTKTSNLNVPDSATEALATWNTIPAVDTVRSDTTDISNSTSNGTITDRTIVPKLLKSVVPKQDIHDPATKIESHPVPTRIARDAASINMASIARDKLSAWSKRDLDDELLIATRNAYRSKHIRALLNRGANVNALDRSASGNSVLGNEIMFSRRMDVLILLFERGVDPNSAVNDFGTVLSYAAFQGHLEVMDLLLENGANPNAPGKKYVSPLHAARDSWNSANRAKAIGMLKLHGAR